MQSQRHKSMETGRFGSRHHRLSTLRFIPEGNKVPRILIHLLSQILCRHGSWLETKSITMTVMSARECAWWLKWATTGESSVLLCMIWWWRPFILRCNGWPVSPTYCWPHFLHVIRYIMIKDLQETTIEILKHLPVVWLVSVFVVKSNGQVLHLPDPQL